MMLGEPGARSSTPLLAVDGDDMVVGATHAARKAARLTDQMIQWGASASDLMAGPGGAGRSDLVEAERGAVKRALSRCGGSVSAAARELGVSRATLHRKMKRLDLHRPSKDA
jgi:transcriptional regulator of acetoin/glycerol metabolism